MSATKIGQVLSCSPGAIIVTIENLEKFEAHKTELQVGRYLCIEQGNHDYTIASIRNIRGVSGEDKENGKLNWEFQIECQAIGTLVDKERFERASLLLPVPTEFVYTADTETLDKLFAEDSDYQFPLGVLSFNNSIPLKVHGDRFFSKHVAVVGSTGSGKSCSVANILHEVVGIREEKTLMPANKITHI